MADLKAVEFKIAKAKTRLILNQPFYASIICMLPFELSPAAQVIDTSTGSVVHTQYQIPTMATDGRRVIYNPDFVESLSLDEVVFVLCHEVMHCVFQHMFRRGQRTARRWNHAGDYVINQLLVDDKIGAMPTGDNAGLLNPQLVLAGGGTTDGVYDLLPEDDGKGDNSDYGQPGGAMDDCMDAGGSQAEQAAAAAEMKVMVAQAAQAAQAQGKLSAGLQRLVDQVLTPQVAWEDVLRRFVSMRAKVEYNYARPKRRWLSEDIILPSLGGEKMGEILIAVDCSGSIGEKELMEFAAEMVGIQQDVHPSAIHVVYFDSEVCHYDKFDEGEELVVAPHGGGGTAFSPIFRYAEEHDIDPVCCVVLTDLYCSDFGPPTAYPTLWVTTAATAAPWGEVVEMTPGKGRNS